MTVVWFCIGAFRIEVKSILIGVHQEILLQKWSTRSAYKSYFVAM